jgi:hypothetical protein
MRATHQPWSYRSQTQRSRPTNPSTDLPNGTTADTGRGLPSARRGGEVSRGSDRYFYLIDPVCAEKLTNSRWKSPSVDFPSESARCSGSYPERKITQQKKFPNRRSLDTRTRNSRRNNRPPQRPYPGHHCYSICLRPVRHTLRSISNSPPSSLPQPKSIHPPRPTHTSQLRSQTILINVTTGLKEETPPRGC